MNYWNYFGLFVLITISGSVCGSSLVTDILNFDTELPEDVNLARALKEPAPRVPFRFHQEFMQETSEEYPYSYDPNHPISPSNWENYYPACGGNNQSPIHIRTSQCIRQSFVDPIEYPNSGKQPTKVAIENNGYSIHWNFAYNGTRPFLTGGPLKSKYMFESVHIHWHTKAGRGSEHFIDSQNADLELHLIHRNLKYRSFVEAAQHRDGLVVIAVLASASKFIRPLNMFKNINDVWYPGSSVHINGKPQGYILRNIIGFLGQEQFVAYKGSLTTPPCSESVLWLVAQRIRKINDEDLLEIRQIRGHEGEIITNNNRPLQPSNNRACILFNMSKQTKD